MEHYHQGFFKRPVVLVAKMESSNGLSILSIRYPLPPKPSLSSLPCLIPCLLDMSQVLLPKPPFQPPRTEHVLVSITYVHGLGSDATPRALSLV
jgi:hypothetical protein